ncbi:GtrA family protein [Stakelama saccharophila]|uniref:GtrA family protein n=1 Tax=Stakelama saccharophila TaxID=3075605 RepID=A0ABZ0BAR2_9SPHN|nr:GtrA family protein [Stakelama sp. W311]WNO54363.1 GtrA family protein [Stakelama sp. W311]
MAVTAISRQVEALRASGVFGQLVRFGIAGGITTLIYTGVYLPLAMFVFAREQAVFAVPFAFAAAVSSGFVLHSKWSFKDHGTRDSSGRQHVKFVAVQGFGLMLHAGITWLLTGLLHQPAWVPLIPGLMIVPLVTFVLNRQWVFA